jgi:hypothetical protein
MILKASDRSSALGGGLGGISLENHFARRTYIYRKFAPEPMEEGCTENDGAL